MSDYNIQVMLKSGKTHVISPFQAPEETSEDAARNLASQIQKDLIEGKAFFPLVTGDTKKFSSVVRLDSIEAIWIAKVSVETEEEKKKRELSNRLTELHVQYYEDLYKRQMNRRPVEDKLTQLQIEHYEVMNQGERWKNDKGY